MPKVPSLVKNLKDFFKSAKKQKAVFGLSGGVDSALTAKLAVMALGKENVMALILPNLDINQSESVLDAENWAKELGISYYIIPINKCMESHDKLPWKASKIAYMNSQARIRANVLYHYANTHNAVVLGTGNKTELTLGYFTKYGDGACDILPIGSLYKSEVWEMAKALKLPKKIIQKTPSAGLFRGQTDEKEIGMSYAEIDRILRKFEKGQKPSSPAEKKLMKRIQANRHKSQMPGII